jgi:hypothetical protein
VRARYINKCEAVEWNFISEKLLLENIQLCFKINNNKINYVPSQTNIKMYFLPYWLQASAITAIIRPILYKHLKKGWLHEVRKMLRCVGPHLQ